MYAYIYIYRVYIYICIHIHDMKDTQYVPYIYSVYIYFHISIYIYRYRSPQVSSLPRAPALAKSSTLAQGISWGNVVGAAGLAKVAFSSSPPDGWMYTFTYIHIEI